MQKLPLQHVNELFSTLIYFNIYSRKHASLFYIIIYFNYAKKIWWKKLCCAYKFFLSCSTRRENCTNTMIRYVKLLFMVRCLRGSLMLKMYVVMLCACDKQQHKKYYTCVWLLWMEHLPFQVYFIFRYMWRVECVHIFWAEL